MNGKFIDRVQVLECATQYGRKAAVALLKSYGPAHYFQTRENYNDLLYQLTDGKEGIPMDSF